jgi:hypothetical protein
MPNARRHFGTIGLDSALVEHLEPVHNSQPRGPWARVTASATRALWQ